MLHPHRVAAKYPVGCSAWKSRNYWYFCNDT